MAHITTWEEDYKRNNTSPYLQSPLANSSSPSSTMWLVIFGTEACLYRIVSTTQRADISFLLST
jgi:hypothetical protein